MSLNMLHEFSILFGSGEKVFGKALGCDLLELSTALAASTRADFYSLEVLFEGLTASKTLHIKLNDISVFCRPTHDEIDTDEEEAIA